MLEYRATTTFAVELPVSSSEEASLHGQKAKTPILAGAICGGVMGIAWIIGFSIYFMKRYRRKQRKRLAAEGKGTLELEKKDPRPQEKIIIPPDPAVLSGQHQPGDRVYPEHKPSHSRSHSMTKTSHQAATHGEPPSQDVPNSTT